MDFNKVPALGESWRNFVKRDLDSAINAWCTCENKRKRPRTVNELNLYNVCAKYDAVQFLIDNPPVSDEESEDSARPAAAIPTFGKPGICGSNQDVDIDMNIDSNDCDCGDQLSASNKKNSDYPHSPGNPRLGNFCATYSG